MSLWASVFNLHPLLPVQTGLQCCPAKRLQFGNVGDFLLEYGPFHVNSMPLWVSRSRPKLPFHRSPCVLLPCHKNIASFNMVMLVIYRHSLLSVLAYSYAFVLTHSISQTLPALHTRIVSVNSSWKSADWPSIIVWNVLYLNSSLSSSL